MRLTHRARSLALIGLLGLGCESVLGLEKTSFSEPDPNAPVADSCGGDTGAAGRGGGGGLGPSGNEGGGAGARDTSGTTTGSKTSDGRASGGGTSGDTNAGGTNAGDTNAGGTNAGDTNAGGTNAGDTNGGGGATTGGSNEGGDTSSGPLTAILQSRSDGRCVGVVPEPEGVEDGPSVALVECNRQDRSQYWQRDSVGRLFCPAVGMYLQATESDMGGAVLSIGPTIDPLAFQIWLFENMHLVNLGGYCIDMPSGDFSDHIRAELASCRPGSPQSWILDPNGAFQHDGQCLDIFDGIAKNGQSVQTYRCQGSPNQLFAFHDMRLQFGGMCIGVQGEFPPLEQALLELQTCLPKTHREVAKQQFYVEGAARILGKCLEASPGHHLGIGSCTDSEPQVWRWIP